MRAAYLWLSRLLALLVMVQAMLIVFAVSGLFHWITEEGGSLDASVAEGWETTPPTFTGAIGHYLHAEIIGKQVVPTVAVLLLIVSFFAKVPKGVAAAVVIGVLVGLQVYTGMNSEHIPYLGLWHGLGALLVFAAALGAAVMAKKARA